MNDEGNGDFKEMATPNSAERERLSHVLLVDDNTSLLMLMSRVLEGEGFSVTSCTTATEALHNIRQHEFGIAVVDLRLPDMQGTQLLKKFRGLGSKVRVIINTAYGEFESAKDALNNGAFGYLEKAGDPNDLVREVHRANRSHFEVYASDLENAVAERSRELTESEAKLRLVFENSPVSLWHEDFSGVKNWLDGLRKEGVENFREYFDHHEHAALDCLSLVKVLDVNLEAVRLHGATSKKELINSLSLTFCEESYSVFCEELIALANGRTSFEADAVMTTLNGEKRDVMVRLFLDSDSPNWSSCYVAVTDITERKRVERESLELQLRLRQTQKMEAIGQLAAGVAHEFNNTLAGILGNAELLLSASNNQIPEHFKRSLTDIERTATRAVGLTKQLLSFAHKKNPQKAQFNFNQVVSNSEEMLRRLVGQNLELRIDLSPASISVVADEAEIEQALVNLTINARDAMTSEGTITIKTACVAIDAGEIPDSLDPGLYAQLSVTDNGCGMSAETVDRIFEPFFTTKPVGKGTGLGLSTVFADIQNNGGFITVSSRLNEGTVFQIHLPQAEGTPQTTPSEIENTQHRPVGSETILICDDDEIVLRSSVMLLETYDYSVIAASTGEEAIQAAADHQGEVALLLTDISMPEMDGQQLAKTLMQQYPDLKVLYASGYGHDIVKSSDGTQIEFLQKPVPIDILTQRIREILDSDRKT